MGRDKQTETHEELGILDKRVNLELAPLIKEWKSAWNEPLGGPTEVATHFRRFISREIAELEKPEEEALEKIIKYCVELIIAAVKRGKTREIVKLIEREFNGPGVVKFYKSKIKDEIMIRLAEKTLKVKA